MYQVETSIVQPKDIVMTAVCVSKFWINFSSIIFIHIPYLSDICISKRLLIFKVVWLELVHTPQSDAGEIAQHTVLWDVDMNPYLHVTSR